MQEFSSYLKFFSFIVMAALLSGSSGTPTPALGQTLPRSINTPPTESAPGAHVLSSPEGERPRRASRYSRRQSTARTPALPQAPREVMGCLVADPRRSTRRCALWSNSAVDFRPLTSKHSLCEGQDLWILGARIGSPRIALLSGTISISITQENL